MSLIKLDLIHAFGSTCSQGYKNCIRICDQQKNETKIVYPIGKAIVRKSIDRTQMDFIQFHQSMEKIQYIFMLPTRQHVAVAYKPYKSQLQAIKIYSFKNSQEPLNIKIFHDSQKIGQIKLMTFSSSQPKFMCLYLGQPHNKLLYVDTFKNKPLAESSFTLRDIDCLTICPGNSHLICVTGGSVLKLFKIQQYTFKPLEDVKRLPKGRRFTTHCWYKRKMIVAATDKCQILILQEARPNIYEIKQQYHNVFNENKIDKMIITAICTFSKGFILGSNNGKFSLWTKKDNTLQTQQSFELSRKWATTEQRAAQVTNIEISSKQDVIAISLANNDISILYINELIPQISDLLNNLADKEIVFQYVYKGFHNNAITGMDICEQRPLIATCSQMDSTVRIWNYKNYGCKLLRMFYFKIKQQFQSDKPLITLAFHPSGYYLAVGCTDKLRFFHVLNNQLRPYRQLGVKKAHIVKFSRGGHLLATCYNLHEQTNINHIKIFNALTLEQLICLKDQTSFIKNLQFKKYDENLLSISEEGNVIEWRVTDWHKTKQIHNKQMKYTCGMYWHERNTIIAFGQSKGTRYIQEFGCQSGSIARYQFDMNVVSICELRKGKQKGLLLSLQSGNLAIFGGLQRPIIMYQNNYHIKKVTQIIKSPCQNYIMTSGQDCMLMIFKAYHQIDGIIQQESSTSIIVDDFLADVVLINKKQIEKINEKQTQYNKVISNLSKKLKQISEESKFKHSKKMLQIQIQKNRVIEDMNYRIQKLKSSIQQLQQKNAIAFQALDNSNLNKVQSLQRTYEEKITFQIQKYFQLEQELIQSKIVHKKQIEHLKQLQEEMIQKLKQEFEVKFKQSQKIYSKAKDSSEQTMNIFGRKLKMIQDQQEQQIKQLNLKKHKFKQQTQQMLKELHERQRKFKKEHNKLTEQRNEQKRKNEQKFLSKRKTQKQVQQAREKLKEMNIQFNQKLHILSVKQKRISQFQDKISQLQKKKHILSYKGTEMKKAMQPKQIQTQKLKNDLIKLKKQFELSLERKQKSILSMQKNQKEKINLEKLLNEQKKQTSKTVQIIDQILSDIHNCIDNFKKIGDNKIFYKQFIKLYHKYINKNEKKEIITQTKGIDQLTKQVLYLQKSLYQMNKTNDKNIIRKNDQIFKRIKENTQLVTNLNQIKKQNKEIVLKIRSKKQEIQKLRMAKEALLSQCKDIDQNTYKMFLQDDFIDNEKHMQKSKLSISRNSASKLNGMSSFVNKDEIKDNKKVIKKAECELISQIQFLNERNHKLDFYIRQMKQKIKKHLINFKCHPDAFINDDEQSNQIDQA